MSDFPFEVGQIIFTRTVTFSYVGKILEIGENFVKLENAAWIADTGRFGEFISNGVLDATEVEMMGIVNININSMVDIVEWTNDLPEKTQ